MDRGAWRTTVHGVAKSRTRLSNFTLEEWEEVGGGREAREGGNICIPMADSC